LAQQMMQPSAECRKFLQRSITKYSKSCLFQTLYSDAQ